MKRMRVNNGAAHACAWICACVCTRPARVADLKILIGRNRYDRAITISLALPISYATRERIDIAFELTDASYLSIRAI